MKIFIDPGHGIQNVIIVSIHCNAYGNGTTWTSPRGWSAYISRGQTPADALATCLYNAAARNLPGMVFLCPGTVVTQVVLV